MVEGDADTSRAEVEARIGSILAAARTHLGMDVAFVTRLEDGVQTFTHLDGDQASFGWQPGTTIPARDGFCNYVLSGEMDSVIRDAAAHPLASRLPAQAAARIGAYIGVPLTLGNNRVYGALCCSAHAPDHDLTVSDAAFMRCLAELVAAELGRLERAETLRQLQRDALTELLQPGALRVVLQPIVDLNTGRVAGAEALARFDGRNPAEVFAAAAAAGMGPELELTAVQAALDLLPLVPDDFYLSINVSPDTLAGGRLRPLLAAVDGPRRLVVELTEHVPVADYPAVAVELEALRGLGVRIAVDDAGSGYASLQHVLTLLPEVIKLDITLVRGVDQDPARRALVSALATFARDLDATLVAEGVETAQELATLRRLGIVFGQGYYLGAPAPVGALEPDRRRDVARGFGQDGPRRERLAAAH